MSQRKPSSKSRDPAVHRRRFILSLQIGAVVLAAGLAWWISRPAGGLWDRPVITSPQSRGPVGNALCGPDAAPRPPPPVDSPYGVHLYATTPLGVVHPLPAMSIADTLMPPPERQAVEKPAAVAVATEGGAAASPPIARNESALDDVEAVTVILEEFRRAFGAMPVGEQNDEIVRRLQGENPRGIAVLPKVHPAISNGELLDRWGTPYRFHPESAWVMTVRSAGPDKRMWSADDILSVEEGAPAVDAPLTAGME